MATETVVIKLLPNADNPKLKMKYVGALEYATPKLGPDGKIRTGLDENALEIIHISDSKEKDALQKKIKKEREELEKLLGVELGPHSSYWEKFYITLSDEDINLDPSNALDRVKEKFLVANAYVAPSLDHIYNDERYTDCIFYLYREIEETSKRAVKQRASDKAKAKLFLLNENNPNKLRIIYNYITGFSEEISPEAAYMKLSDFISVPDNDQRKKNVDLFLGSIEKTLEEMQMKLIFDKAIRKKIIVKKGNIYRRAGDETKILGSSYEEALETLGSVDWNSELVSLTKEVDN